MIASNGIRKTYGTHVALQGLTLQIPEGSIFGLLGPNGSGKTTFIRILTQILVPDSGTLTLDGKPLNPAHRLQMGYLPEERGLYRKMKVQDQLLYLLSLKGMSAAEAKSQSAYWLERMGLADRARSKVQELSKGMQQKVQFIATIAHTPRLLILDEPFSGLDPINSQLLQEVMEEYRAKGRTVLFSTHRMEQVEELCDHIALINKGHLLLNDRMEAVQDRYRTDRYRFQTLEVLSAEEVAALPAQVVSHQGRALELRPLPGQDARQLIAHVNAHHTLTACAQYVPPLKDIFVQLVQQKGEPAHA
ncbi:MAG: ATP-binding cassette domain-containing protein [Bacteroidetes bacterium]|nr:ATP-binding cassette domain-containing protein [Bacteroidota bacterium]